MKKFCKILLFLSVIISINANAQKGNSILWQISGNGLKTPSYLFGSIHITDKKVFDFPDSVIAKLKQCEATAFELDLDSVSGLMLKDALKKEKKKHVNEILSRKEMEALKKELKKKNIFIDDIDNEVPLNVYNRYKRKLYKNNSDMSTFLDAYLYRIAKLYGKNIIGIETYNEQVNAITSMKDDDQKKLLLSMSDSTYNPNLFMDSLISLYLQENIDAVYNLLHRYTAADFENVILTKRNYVMDRRIDSLIRHQSTFICVGTGHLPGDEGLITLLSKRGYTLTPLRSPRTGYYKTILPEENTDNWRTVTDVNGGYRVKMPGEATPMNISGLEMKGYMDLGTGYFYMTASFPSSGKEKRSSGKIMDEMIKRFETLGEVTSKKSVKYNDMQGFDIELKKPKVAGYVIRVLNDTSNAYLLMIGVANATPEKNVVKKFFNSMITIERPKLGEIVFKDDTAAFQMRVPSNFKVIEDEENELGTRYKTFSCLDYSLQGLISVTYMDYSPGLYFPDLDRLYESVFDPVQRALDTKPEYIIDTTFNGYKSRDCKIVANDKSTVYVRYILRCSRLYVVSVTCRDPSKDKEALARLSSFDFISPMKPQLQSYTSSENDFKVMMPGKVKTKVDSSEYVSTKTYEYGASDKNSSNWFKIYAHEFSDYDHLKNDSSLLAFMKNYVTSYNDSIIDSSIVKNENGKICNFKIGARKNTGIARNVRTIINGRHFYILVAIDDLLHPLDSLNNALLNSFEILHPDRSFDVSASKKDKLLSDLQSSDTVVYKKAFKEFKNYDFEKNDLPEIEKTLSKKFVDDTSQAENTRYWIYDRIYSIMDSTQKVSYIKNNYAAMPDSGSIRVDALNELARIRSSEALDLWKQLILANHPKLKHDWEIYLCSGPMNYDSIPLVSSLFPEFSKLVDDPQFRQLYYSISANALKYKIISTDVYASMQDKIFKDARSEYKHMNIHEPGKDDYYSSSFTDAMYMLNLLPPSEPVIQLNKEIISDTVSDEKLGSFVYLAKNNVDIDKKVLKKYLSTPSNRNALYDKLKELNKLDVFPSKMKKQELFAEGDIYAIAGYDDISPTKVKLIDERKINFKGQLQRFYIYRVYYGEDYSYLGVAGPYPLSDKELVTSGSATALDDLYAQETLEENIKAFIKKAEDAK